MSKYIIIDDCEECPHVLLDDDCHPGKAGCFHPTIISADDISRELEDVTLIPSWCPLPGYVRFVPALPDACNDLGGNLGYES